MIQKGCVISICKLDFFNYSDIFEYYEASSFKTNFTITLF